MKIVYNSNSYGLRLTADEMQMLASKLNLTLTQHDKDSTQTWFAGVDWQEFRANPLLVSMVEANAFNNKNLCVAEVDDGTEWHIDTDWYSYEQIVDKKAKAVDELYTLLDGVSDAIYYADSVLYREDVTAELNKAMHHLRQAVKAYQPKQ